MFSKIVVILFLILTVDDTRSCENRDTCFEHGMLHCPVNGLNLPSISVVCNNLEIYAPAAKYLQRYAGGLRPDNIYISFEGYGRLIARCLSICMEIQNHIENGTEILYGPGFLFMTPAEPFYYLRRLLRSFWRHVCLHRSPRTKKELQTCFGSELFLYFLKYENFFTILWEFMKKDRKYASYRDRYSNSSLPIWDIAYCQGSTTDNDLLNRSNFLQRIRYQETRRKMNY